MSKTKDSKGKDIPKEEAEAWDAFASFSQRTQKVVTQFAEWETFAKSVEKQNEHRLNLAKIDAPKSRMRLINHQPNMLKEVSAVEITSLDRNERKLLLDKGGVERFIDLHGLRKEEAFNCVFYAIILACERNIKILKIITGKGIDQKDEFGELYISIKSLLPQWLATPQLRSKIRKVTPAIESDGGEGAFYVYLKKRR